MYLLFGVFFYLLFFSWLIYKRKLAFQIGDIGQNNWYLFVGISLLILLACFRGMYVGNDTYSYYALFQYYTGRANTYEMSISRLLWMDNLEVGYRTLNFLIGKYTGSYQLFISTIAILSYCITWRFIRRYSSNVALSLILFFLLFYSVYMNLLRQVLAMSVVMLAFDSLNNNKRIRFVIGVLLATVLFHRTAIISLAILPMSQFKSRKGLLWLATGIAAAVVALGQIPVLIALMGITTRYTELTSGISIVFAIIRSLIILLFAGYLKNGEWVDVENVQQEDYVEIKNMLNPRIAENLISWIPFICLLVSICALGLSVATRFQYYFLIFLVVLIPRMINTSSRDNSNIRIVLNLLLLTLILYNAGKIIYRPDWVTEYNYYFFWSKPY